VSATLIIATYRRPDALRETLSSLRSCDPLPDEVLLVDGDPERSAARVAAEFADLPVRHLASPRGLTVQRNRGIDAAREELLVFADDDIEFDRRIFAVLRDTFADETVVGATARVIEPDPRSVGGARSRLRSLLPGGGREGTVTRFGYPRRIVHPEVPRDVEFVHGCLMAARREIAAAVRFDEGMVGAYALAEDEDFGYRLSRSGRVRYVPDAVVVHKVLGKITGIRTREFNRMLVRNRAYLFRKSFAQTPPARAQFALMIGVLALHRALNREWAGVRGIAEGALMAWRERGTVPGTPAAGRPSAVRVTAPRR
jgi:GT2 family glycosyltransferase